MRYRRNSWPCCRADSSTPGGAGRGMGGGPMEMALLQAGFVAQRAKS